MRTCREARELIEQEEGFHAAPYQDVAGVWTIGFGHTGTLFGRPISEADPISREYGSELLADDLADAEAAVDRLVAVPLSRYQFGALVSFTFNLGAGNLARSTLLRKLNAGDYDGAAWEFRKWRKAGGEIQPGLLTRRGREEQLFRLGIPEHPGHE